MQKVKIFKIIFTFAAILFLAKPFLGFKAFGKEVKPHISYSMLVKSFTKRKPENLDEAYTSAQALHQRIANPPLMLLAGLILPLSALLSFLLDEGIKLTASSISTFRWLTISPQPAYLLSGKLTI
jgi:hypothetical protein